MKLLITGGTGFFGRALLRYLSTGQPHQKLKTYEQVVVLTRSPQNFTEQHPALASLPWLELHQADVTDAASLKILNERGTFDHVIHAATDSTSGNRLTPTQQLDQIVNGTQNMLEFAIENGCKRFLLTSSGGVYGPQPAEMAEIPEDFCGIPDPLSLTSTYGLGKRMAEHLCKIYAEQHGLKFIIARCFAFVGEDLPLDAHFAIGNFIRDALTRTEITVNGNGKPVRSYMDQRDLAHWLMTLLHSGQDGHAYNVGSNLGLSISELAHLVRDTIAPSKQVKIMGDNGKDQAHRNLYIPNVEKAKNELGLGLTISLAEAIRHTASKKSDL